MRVLRGRPGNPSLRLSCITRPMQLRTVSHRPMGPISLYIYCAPLYVDYPPTPSFDGSILMDPSGRARFFWFLDQYFLLLFWIWFDSNLNWAVRTPCILVFSMGGHIRVWILLYFYIILFSHLIWDLGMSEGFSPLAPGWYRESRELSFGPWLVQRVSHLYYIIFWYFTGSYLILAIWQLKV
jgi:hypothetical protein